MVAKLKLNDRNLLLLYKGERGVEEHGV